MIRGSGDLSLSASPPSAEAAGEKRAEKGEEGETPAEREGEGKEKRKDGKQEKDARDVEKDRNYAAISSKGT